MVVHFVRRTLKIVTWFTSGSLPKKSKMVFQPSIFRGELSVSFMGMFLLFLSFSTLLGEMLHFD